MKQTLTKFAQMHFEDESSQTKHAQQLPAKYTSIPHAQALPKDVQVPVYNGRVMPPTLQMKCQI